MSINNEKIDILNRDEFINRVIQLVHLISSNRGNMTFAIDGEWGCGKTFVLDSITGRLNEDNKHKFLVIPYNCWQYDYYSEPLIAVVSALLDFIDDTKTLSESAKLPLKKTVLSIGKRIVLDVVKNKIGFDAKELIDEANDIAESSKEKIDKAHNYDSFYSFKQVLKGLKEEFNKLTDEYSIVFIVDELDRCMPEYAIKVLERLHHISEGIPNMITIVSVDKQRIKKTIGSVFGEENIDPYLKKFIRFEIHLDSGKQNCKKFFEKFQEFYNRFDATLYGKLIRTERFIDELFRGIDIRSQERIIEKATLFNDLCFGNKKQDHTIMYMVLFLSTLYYHYQNSGMFDPNKYIDDIENVFAEKRKMPHSFMESNNGFCLTANRVVRYNGRVQYIIMNVRDVYNIIMYYWFNLPKSEEYLAEGGPCRPILDEGDSELMDYNNAIRKNIQLLQNNVYNLKVLR